MYSRRRKEVIVSQMTYAKDRLSERKNNWIEHENRYSEEMFSPLVVRIEKMIGKTNQILEELNSPKCRDSIVERYGSELNGLYEKWMAKEEEIDEALKLENGFTKKAVKDIVKILEEEDQDLVYRSTLPDEYEGGSHPHSEFMNQFRMNYIFIHQDFPSLEALFALEAIREENEDGESSNGNENNDGALEDFESMRELLGIANIEPLLQPLQPRPPLQLYMMLSRGNSVESLAVSEYDEVWNEYVTLEMAFPEPPKKERECGSQTDEL